MTTLTIAARFNGPPDSANGGYTCGVIAALVGDEAVVTLRNPPPLERAMDVRPAEGGVQIYDGATLIADATSSGGDVTASPYVPFADAEKAATPGSDHPFPTCFVCGPARTPGDGLRLFVGPIPGTSLVAGPWVPGADLAEDGLVRAEFVWAALDCPGGWVGDGDVRVLGRMDARVYSRPRAGERCVVSARQAGQRTERKWHAESALYGEDGSLYAAARSTWIILRAV